MSLRACNGKPLGLSSCLVSIRVSNDFFFTCKKSVSCPNKRADVFLTPSCRDCPISESGHFLPMGTEEKVFSFWLGIWAGWTLSLMLFKREYANFIDRVWISIGNTIMWSEHLKMWVVLSKPKPDCPSPLSWRSGWSSLMQARSQRQQAAPQIKESLCRSQQAR